MSRLAVFLLGAASAMVGGAAVKLLRATLRANDSWTLFFASTQEFGETVRRLNCDISPHSNNS